MAIPVIPGTFTKVSLPEDEKLAEEERTLFYIAAKDSRMQMALMKHARMMKKITQAIEEAHRKEAEAEGVDFEKMSDEEKKAFMAKMSDSAAEKVFEFTLSEAFFADTLGVAGKPKGLTGWENFNNPETGEPIRFEPDTFLTYLSLMQQVFLAMKVFNAQFLTGDDQKN